MSTMDLYERIRFRGEPRANPRAVVVRGQARFTVLTPRLLRLEWSDEQTFEDRSTYAFPTRYVDTPPAFTVAEQDGWLVLDTGALELRYALESGPFAPDNLSIALERDGETQIWRPGMLDLGNLKGTRRTLDRCAGDADLEPGLISRAGWVLFDDTKNVIFDDAGWVGPRPDGDFQDWYFLGYGHDYVAALQDYRAFGGKTPLIPRFILGAWWSRYWAYSEADLRDLVSQFEEHRVPLDVLVIDMDWHTPHAWTGYSWNRELFPDPPAFLQWVHEKGLHVTLNLHPAQGVQAFEDMYHDFAQALGVDPTESAPVPFRIADKSFVKAYFEMLHHPMEDQGVDFWWMDWQQGEISEVKGLDPLPWINHLHFNDIRRRGVRPMLYSRWGGLGNHRYYIGFSGDTYVTWESLQFQPYMTATASNVLFGWWSHDIGGHMGGATEPELYARWVQFGALSPVLRMHSTKDPRGERRPWAYPEPVYEAAKAAFLWRYEMTPYLYTMAREASDTGLSLCRPMYYEHPEADDAYAARYQYYFGNQSIAAPIVFPADPATGLASVDVWLPKGTWYARDTLESFEGGRWVRLLGDLNRIPMLMKAGAVLPLAARWRRWRRLPGLASGTTNTQPQDQLVIEVFPGEGAFRVYRDDGETEAYRDGASEWIPVQTRQADDGQSWIVDVGPVEGNCLALPDEMTYEVRLAGADFPERVFIDGEPGTYRYDPDRPAAIVPLVRSPKSTGFTIKAMRSEGIVAAGAARNAALVDVDLARLLGDAAPAAGAGLGQALEQAGRAPSQAAALNAVARAGGPFFHAVEFAAPDEASQHLGRLVVMGPADGSPVDVTIDFSVEREGQVETQQVVREGLVGSAVIDVPFRHDGTIARLVWRADVAFAWDGHTLEGAYTSRPLFPGIYRWHALMFNAGADPTAPEDVARFAARADYPAEFTEFVPHPGSTCNLNEALVVRFWEEVGDRVRMFDAPEALMATTVVCPSDREAVLEFSTAGACDIYVNGERADLLVTPIDPELQVYFRPPQRTAVVRLRAGDNTLVVRTRAPEGAPGAWFFGARFLSPDGADFADLGYR